MSTNDDQIRIEKENNAKRAKAHPTTISMGDLVLEIEDLKEEVRNLRNRVSSLEADIGPIM